MTSITKDLRELGTRIRASFAIGAFAVSGESDCGRAGECGDGEFHSRAGFWRCSLAFVGRFSWDLESSVGFPGFLYS